MRDTRECVIRGFKVACFVAVLVGWCGLVAGKQADAKGLARLALGSAPNKTGLCVHVDCGDGQLAAELAKEGKFVIHGLAADQETVEKAKATLESAGVYGKASVTLGNFKELPYADNLVNLLVVDDMKKAQKAGLTLQEAIRVVCPKGHIFVNGLSEKELKKKLAKVRLKGVADGGIGFEMLRRPRGWAKITKPRPEGMDEWTHYWHGPDRNAASQDTFVGTPGRLQWLDGRAYGASGGRGAAFLSANGRFFHTWDRARVGGGPSRPLLVARDAYNGLLLWTKPLSPDTQPDKKDPTKKNTVFWFNTQAFVAVGDRVYCVLKKGGPLSALDAATGDTLVTYKEGGTPEAVVYYQGTLLLMGGGPLRALHAATGKALWKSEYSVNTLMKKARLVGGIVVGEGKVFLDQGKGLVALDVKTGEQIWNNAGGPRGITFYYKGVLGMRGPAAISAKDGRLLWTHKPEYRTGGGGRRGYRTPDFAAGDLYWYRGTDQKLLKEHNIGGIFVGLDLNTGEVKRRVRHANWEFRCYRNTATPNYAILGNTRTVNLKTGEGTGNCAIRGACIVGYLPANGMIYTFPDSCVCVSSMRRLKAAVPAGVEPDEFKPDKLTDSARFRRGPAFGKVQPDDASVSETDWPTYRSDVPRSGWAKSEVAADVKPVWTTDLKADISSPVVAGGRAYVARIDKHQVVALDAKDGKVIWRFTGNGRIAIPPTIYKGLCLFATRTGWVTCLRASDGAHVWSFRAAPKERLIMAYGQLESSWSVPGGVLVQNDVLFFGAGRHSELLGGIYVYAADPFTGKIKWTARHQSVDGSYQYDLNSDKLLWKKRSKIIGTDNVPGRMDWARNEMWSPNYRTRDILHDDLLVGDDEYVYMRCWGFNQKDGKSLYKADHLKTVREGESLLAETTYLHRKYNAWKHGRDFAHMMVFDKTHLYAFRHRKFGVGAEIFGKTLKANKGSWRWSFRPPIRVKGMLLAGKTLFLGGFPEVTDAKEPWAAFEGKKGGVLWSVSTEDGRVLNKQTMESPPYFDGMAAANGRLYVSTQGGKLICLGK